MFSIRHKFSLAVLLLVDNIYCFTSYDHACTHEFSSLDGVENLWLFVYDAKR